MSSPQTNSKKVPADQTVMEDSEIPNPIPCYQDLALIRATSMPYYSSYELQTWSFEDRSFYEVGSHIEVIETESSDTENTDYSSWKSCDSSGFCTSPEPAADDIPMAVMSSPVSSSVPSPVHTELNLDGEESTLQTTDWSEPPFDTHSQGEHELTDTNPEQEVDEFYKTYSERMKWFDVLCHDRIYGIDAILKDLERSSFLVTWDKMAREKLIKSLKSDLELVYVAQSCLSWEALQHQYWKVKTVSENGVYHKSIADAFQRFQILLERFMEDEPFEGKWYRHYVHKRFSIKSLLQVPEVSGYTEEENVIMKGETVKANGVLRAIENCIHEFWLYVGVKCRKPIWNILSTISWTHQQPVEDPRDLELFFELRKSLQKKELWVKALKGKKKCWLKKTRKSVNPLLIESEKNDLLFTMIDLKLVKKVLRLAALSTSQLKWCQAKLNNIELAEGKVHRTQASYFFPSS